ncbi:hypothetical protein [Streptococcus sp. sy004]|uniref:hypothetical protein n=1 Tax=Streptococcus sp. sy004 TaxID=2600149 RepID=UPI0011B65E30|nr:hypothetical protein [Streptococcus sp. sy004]TWT09866.1 hypothetical protein FRX54_05455 [Streptococcus sp. sy004]
MKLKTFILSGLVGATLYKLYDNRQVIEAEVKDKTNRLKQGKQDFSKAQDSLATIQKESQAVSKLGQDLSYQTRVFQTEVQATMQEINKLLNKYKTAKLLSTSDKSQ